MPFCFYSLIFNINADKLLELFIFLCYNMVDFVSRLRVVTYYEDISYKMCCQKRKLIAKQDNRALLGYDGLKEGALDSSLPKAKGRN